MSDRQGGHADPRKPGSTGEPAATDARRIVVVGPCASGKTTLVAALRRLGFDATVCGQEHSEIPTLWRHTDPDVVIALAVDLQTVRRRRGHDWPAPIYAAQQRRLSGALARADLVLDTSIVGVETAAACVTALMAHGDISHPRGVLSDGSP